MRSSFGGQIDDVRADSSSELIWDLLLLFFSGLEAALLLWALGLLFSSTSDGALLEDSVRMMKGCCSGWKKAADWKPKLWKK